MLTVARFAYSEEHIWKAGALCSNYIIYSSFEEIKRIAEPFKRYRFERDWRRQLPDSDILIRQRLKELYRLSDTSEEYRNFEERAFVKHQVIDETKTFLQRYGEGALVVLELIAQARFLLPFYGKSWRSRYEHGYTHFSMREVPAIEGTDRLEQLKLI